MRIDEQMVAALLARPQLTALIGDRVYPDLIPEKKPLPAVVYRFEVFRTIGLDGSVQAVRWRFTIEAWASTRTAADAVGDEVMAALEAAGQAPEGPASLADPDIGCFASAVENDWWDD